MFKSSWQVFSYNYGWSKYVPFLDGWIPKLALFVPIIGYLILFNDSINELISFTKITGEVEHKYSIDGITRLRLIYFGLVFLGVSNLIFKIRKPKIFINGTNLMDYTNTCYKVFTYHDYTLIDHDIRDSGHLTHYGETGSKNFRDKISFNDMEESEEGYKNLLKENFFRYNIINRVSLTLCIFLSSLGYVALVIPSIDLFIKVFIVSFLV